MSNIEETLKEIADRMRRMESRLVQLGDHVGANLRTKQRIEIVSDGDGTPPWVEIDALDVSISRIVTELQQHAVDAQAVDVYLNTADAPVATLHLK